MIIVTEQIIIIPKCGSEALKEHYNKPATTVYIRNPWMRCVSGYYKQKQRKWLNLTFDEWIDFLCMIDVNAPWCDAHWRAQYTFYDNSCRVEKIEDSGIPNRKSKKPRHKEYHGIMSHTQAIMIHLNYMLDVLDYTYPKYLVSNRKADYTISAYVMFRIQTYRIYRYLKYKCGRLIKISPTR